jgi:hypothetical protein
MEVTYMGHTNMNDVYKDLDEWRAPRAIGTAYKACNVSSHNEAFAKLHAGGHFGQVVWLAMNAPKVRNTLRKQFCCATVERSIIRAIPIMANAQSYYARKEALLWACRWITNTDRTHKSACWIHEYSGYYTGFGTSSSVAYTFRAAAYYAKGDYNAALNQIDYQLTLESSTTDPVMEKMCMSLFWSQQKSVFTK